MLLVKFYELQVKIIDISEILKADWQVFPPQDSRKKFITYNL